MSFVTIFFYSYINYVSTDFYMFHESTSSNLKMLDAILGNVRHFQFKCNNF